MRMENKEPKQKEEVVEGEKKKKGGKGKKILPILLALLIIGGGFTGVYFWEESHWFTTENAKVAADLKTVSPLSAGRIVKWNVSVGDAVQANEVLGRLQSGSYMRAPIDGTVVRVGVVENQMVSTATVAAVVAATKDVYIAANIEETDIRKVQLDQEVFVKLDAVPGRKFKAHVSEIDAVTQSALSGNATSYSTSGTYTKVTQLIPVKIRLDEDVALEEIIGTNALVRIRIN